MVDAPAKSVFDVATDFFASQPTDEELLAYELPPDQQARLNELIEIDANSRLTAAQREEFGDYRFVEDILARVKVKIRQRLEREQGAGGANAKSASDAAQDKENGP